MTLRALAWAVALAALPACHDDDGDDDGGAAPFFPEDYESAYTEVRGCRGSGDHDLNNIRVWASAEAVTPYQGQMDPFPEGAVLVKAEYEFGDITCANAPVQWTTMRRLAVESSPDTLDWSWQQVDFDRRVVEEDSSQCIACHTNCGQKMPPPGIPYESTCTLP